MQLETGIAPEYPPVLFAGRQRVLDGFEIRLGRDGRATDDVHTHTAGRHEAVSQARSHID